MLRNELNNMLREERSDELNMLLSIQNCIKQRLACQPTVCDNSVRTTTFLFEQGAKPPAQASLVLLTNNPLL